MLIKSVKDNGDENSFLLLVERHSGLFYKMYGKFAFAMSKYGYEKANLEADKNFLFFKSIKSYKRNKKSKFSTWVGNQTRYFCLNFINKRKKTIDSQFTVFSLPGGVEKEAAFQSKDESVMIDLKDALSKVKDKRIVDIFNSRYILENLSWNQIGKRMGCSVQTVLNLHHKGKKILEKNMAL